MQYIQNPRFDDNFKKSQNLDYTLVVKSCRKVVICLGKVWVKLLFVGEKLVLVSGNAKKI